MKKNRLCWRLSGRLSLFVAAVLIMAGCRTYYPPGTGYVPHEEAGVMTIALDDHDYDIAARGICNELFARGLPEGFVVVLGPVDTRESPYDVRVRQLQKSMQVILNREGTLKFMSAIDAMAGGSAVEEIYKIIQFNWMNANPMDIEELQTLGRLARINGILFGRVSSIERNLPDGGREISYRFVWELVNTENGLLEVSHEQRIRKNISLQRLRRQ